jgi:hypothetical protein
MLLEEGLTVRLQDSGRRKLLGNKPDTEASSELAKPEELFMKSYSQCESFFGHSRALLKNMMF